MGVAGDDVAMCRIVVLLAAGPAVSETADLLLRGARLPGQDGLANIAIIGERIAGVDIVARPARETIDSTAAW